MTHIEKILIDLSEKYTKKKDISLNSETRFKQDLSFDSLSLTEFIIACEDEFGIEIDLDTPEALNIKTIGDLAKAIETLLH